MEKEKYESIKFRDDDFELDVKVSPQEDTVWLSQDEMASLFEVDRTRIGRHINNIYSDDELQRETTCAESAHMGSNGLQKYTTKLYNLDMIISVGYRVKSKRGIAFRKWANKILKQYLLRGYVIDEERTLVTNENFVNLINKVDNINYRLNILESEQKNRIFMDNEGFVAKMFLKQLFSEAKNKIILIDSYADNEALEYLKAKRKNVVVDLYYSSNSRLKAEDIDNFNAEVGNLNAHIINSFHDRFIVLDDKEVLHLGTSLNYIGKKAFAITKMDSDLFIPFIMDKLR